MRLSRLALLVAIVAAAPSARAAILGDEGVEIEGAMDRRGFFWRPVLSFGAQFPEDEVAASGRFTLVLGAGLNRNTTVGAELGVGGLFGDYGGTHLVADLQLTQFFSSGTFVQAALGVAPVAHHDEERRGDVVLIEEKTSLGFGGRAGLGQEVWTGATSAFGIGAYYDLRIDPDQNAVHGAQLAAYLAFY